VNYIDKNDNKCPLAPDGKHNWIDVNLLEVYRERRKAKFERRCRVCGRTEVFEA